VDSMACANDTVPSRVGNPSELTGNETLGRDIEHFTQGLAEIFLHYSRALKENAPLVFTYHHNDPDAYVPIVVAILDAGLDCTATLPAVAEMSASLHILGTGSSFLDTVFVCRETATNKRGFDWKRQLRKDARDMRRAGVSLSKGDLRCLLAGHWARLAVNQLRSEWRKEWALARSQDAKNAVVLCRRERNGGAGSNRE
jgi:putative DNA methylase